VWGARCDAWKRNWSRMAIIVLMSTAGEIFSSLYTRLILRDVMAKIAPGALTLLGLAVMVTGQSPQAVVSGLASQHAVIIALLLAVSWTLGFVAQVIPSTLDWLLQTVPVDDTKDTGVEKPKAPTVGLHRSEGEAAQPGSREDTLVPRQEDASRFRSAVTKGMGLPRGMKKKLGLPWVTGATYAQRVAKLPAEIYQVHERYLVVREATGNTAGSILFFEIFWGIGDRFLGQAGPENGWWPYVLGALMVVPLLMWWHVIALRNQQHVHQLSVEAGAGP